MRLIDYLRLNPITVDLSAPNKKLDTRPLIPSGVQCFDISEIEQQLVVKREIESNDSMTCHFTQRGKEILDGILHSDPTQAPLFGLIAPYDYSWWEYPLHMDGYLSTGIAVRDITSIFNETHGGKVDELKARGAKYMMDARFINLYTMNNLTYAVYEGYAMIASDENGLLVGYKNESNLPNCTPQNASLAVLLVSLMMLNHGMLKREPLPSPPISRQQRRYAARHNTTPFVPIQFHFISSRLTVPKRPAPVAAYTTKAVGKSHGTVYVVTCATCGAVRL